LNILFGNDLKTYKKIFDMAIITVGTIPATRFIKKAGIKVDNKDYVTVDKHMKTNIDNIYAIGDIAKVESMYENIYVTPAVAPPSKRQARVVGDNILRNKFYI
jgi:pyridine nucleotide-disulfide oxidoreductase